MAEPIGRRDREEHFTFRIVLQNPCGRDSSSTSVKNKASEFAKAATNMLLRANLPLRTQALLCLAAPNEARFCLLCVSSKQTSAFCGFPSTLFRSLL